MLAHLHAYISQRKFEKKTFFIQGKKQKKKILYAHSKIKNSEELQLVLHACITISNTRNEGKIEENKKIHEKKKLFV